MASQGENAWSRREFLRGPTLAGTAVILGLKSESAAAEPPPETTRIRIHDAPITCFAPVYIAEELLKAEGFTDVQYIKTPLNEGPTKALAEGKIDITQNDTAGHLMELDVGAPVVVLGGIHTGCWELFANDSVRTLRDLKGKTVAAPERSSRQAFVAGLADEGEPQSAHLVLEFGHRQVGSEARNGFEFIEGSARMAEPPPAYHGDC